MNLVDSCGWLEYFAQGANADFFAPAIEDRAQLLVPTICIHEVFKRLLQQRGEAIADDGVTLMKQGRVVALDGRLAMESALLGVETGLPLADSIILAAARMHDACIWTQDAHFRDIDGVQYVEKR